MRTKILLAGLLCLLLVSCKALEKKVAEIVLDGQLQRTYTDFNSPQFEGHVKNIGTGTGYNCGVTITCYSDTGKTNIIDTANGFPANLGDIAPGQRAYFDAVAFACESHDDILAYDVSIDWLDRD